MDLVERCARASRDARAVGSVVAKLSDCDRRIALAIIPIVLEEAAKVVTERAEMHVVTSTRQGQRNRAYDTAEAIRSLPTHPEA